MKRKLKSDRGFTLAELLIVVAIIGVLVAIAIPIFTGQLEKSREAVDLSDVRSAYAEVMMAAITGDTSAMYTKNSSTIYDSQKNVYTITVSPLKQQKEGWDTPLPITIGGISSSDPQHWINKPEPNGSCVITYYPPKSSTDTESVTFVWSGASGDNGNGGTSGGDGGNTGGDSNTDNGGDSNNGNDSSESDIINDLRYNGITYPDTPPSDNSFQLIKGNIYIYHGVLYIARAGKTYTNKYDFPRPDNDAGSSCFVIPTTRILTSKNVENDGRDTINGDINEGDIFKADNGTLYVRKYYTKNGQAPPTDLENWVKINLNSSSNYPS